MSGASLDELLEESIGKKFLEPLHEDIPCEELDDMANAVFVGPKKRGRKQASPKHLSELPEESPAKKAKRADAKKDESDKYKSFAKMNEKFLKKVPKVKGVLCLSEPSNQKALADPDTIKAYLLPAFHFLDTYEIHITSVSEFDNVVVQTPDVLAKLEKLHKLSGDLALSSAVLEQFEKKYGKKYWKIPKKDYAKVKRLIQSQGYAKAVLYDIETEVFPNRLGDHEPVACLMPVMRYE
jgi:hypothetical protein